MSVKIMSVAYFEKLLIKHFASLTYIKIPLQVSFADPPKYMIGFCATWADGESPSSCANKNRVWTFRKQGGKLQLFCNGGVIFDFDYSKSSKKSCRNNWSVDTVQFRFEKSDKSSDSYRKLPKSKPSLCLLSDYTLFTNR